MPCCGKRGLGHALSPEVIGVWPGQAARPGYKEDVPRFLKRQPPEGFDLVFMDPPYRKNLAEPALRALADRGWLAPGAFVTAEIEKDVALTPPASFNLLAERLFGQTRICIWTAS